MVVIVALSLVFDLVMLGLIWEIHRQLRNRSRTYIAMEGRLRLIEQKLELLEVIGPMR